MPVILSHMRILKKYCMKLLLVLLIVILQTSCLSIFMHPNIDEINNHQQPSEPPNEKPYLMVKIEGHDLNIWSYMRYDNGGNLQHGKIKLKKGQSITLENGWEIVHAQNYVLISQTKVSLDQLNVFVEKDKVRIGGFIQTFER